MVLPLNNGVVLAAFVCFIADVLHILMKKIIIKQQEWIEWSEFSKIEDGALHERHTETVRKGSRINPSKQRLLHTAWLQNMLFSEIGHVEAGSHCFAPMVSDRSLRMLTRRRLLDGMVRCL